MRQKLDLVGVTKCKCLWKTIWSISIFSGTFVRLNSGDIWLSDVIKEEDASLWRKTEVVPERKERYGREVWKVVSSFQSSPHLQCLVSKAWSLKCHKYKVFSLNWMLYHEQRWFERSTVSFNSLATFKLPLPSFAVPSLIAASKCFTTGNISRLIAMSTHYISERRWKRPCEWRLWMDASPRLIELCFSYFW